MRIVIFAMGSAGDVHPFLGVGRALAARGHEVVVAASGFFAGTVAAAGLNFRELGSAEDYERLCSHPDLWHPRRALAAVLKQGANQSYPRILDIARELHKPGDTVVVASSLAFGARNARDVLGVPLVSVHLAPSLLPSVHRQPVVREMPFGQGAPRFLKALQWRIAGRLADHYVTPVLNRFRRSHGLPPARDMLFDWWHSPDATIGLWPAWFAPPQPDWPRQVRLTGFPVFDESGLRGLPDGLAEFLDAGEPPVVFTPGSAMANCAPFFREAARSLRLLGRRGILLTRYAEKVPANLPPDVRHFPYVPFSQVLPRCAALVHHGGVGTCAQALQAGIPQLVQPMAHDQHDNASRLRDLGVADALAPERFLAPEIARRLGRLLGDPAASSAAADVARKFRPAEWIAETCDLIETTAYSG